MQSHLRNCRTVSPLFSQLKAHQIDMPPGKSNKKPKKPTMSKPDPSGPDSNKASGTFKDHDFEDTIVTDGGTSNYKKQVIIQSNETRYAGDDSGLSSNAGRSKGTHGRRPIMRNTLLNQGGNNTYDEEVKLTSTRVIVPVSEFRGQQRAPAEQVGIVSGAFDTLLYYLAEFFGAFWRIVDAIQGKHTPTKKK